MDSGNSSGSLQSSSGGDEEYDSRGDQGSSFSCADALMINQNQNNHVGLGLGPFTSTSNSFANSHTLPQRHHSNNSHMLEMDPLSISNYLDPMQRSASLPNSNLDMIMWSKPAAISQPNPTDLGGLLFSSPSPPPPPQQQQQQQQNHALLLSGEGQTARDSGAFLALPPDSSKEGGGGSRGLLSVSAAANNNDQPHNNNVVRNPKKRSRASRRAPTTVLTTDTTNFRAMVQEFTGIPAHPFTSSSPFPRTTTFDLFGSTSSRLLDPSPPYLLRPFAHKHKLHHPLHPFPPNSSNSMLQSLLASNTSTNNSVTNPASVNYQLSSPSDHLGLLKHPLNVNVHTTTTSTTNNNHPILAFQNILQPSQKYPLGNPPSSLLASKTQPSLEIPPPSGDSHLKVGVFEELGLRGHAHVSTTDMGALRQNMVSGGNNSNLGNASTEWAQRTGTITNDDGDQGGGGGLGVTVNYSNVADRVTITNGKAQYSASSSEFRGEKGADQCTVSARSEGMVESWINCSSDN